MNGVDIVGELLRRDGPLGALVPPTSIKAAMLPDGIALPAIVVRSISLIDRQALKRGPVVRSIERVAVTVRAASYRDQVAAIRLIRAACAGFTGDIAGAFRVSILTAGTGPDVSGPADSFEQAQDLRVSFDAPA